MHRYSDVIHGCEYVAVCALQKNIRSFQGFFF